MTAPVVANQALVQPERTAVAVDGITVRYRAASGHQVTAVDDVSLSIAKGSWCVLLGPSGSGKSSFLYVLGGLLTPSEGTVEVDGQRLDLMVRAQRATYRLRSVGFVFQSYQLIPHLEAWENVALPLLANGIAPQKRRQRAEDLLSEVGLKDRIHHRPLELSGGEQQRVALARAVANEPTLVLADEPTGNLDAKSAEAILDLLSLLVQRGVTVVVATHDAALAKRGTAVVRMSHGVIRLGDGS